MNSHTINRRDFITAAAGAALAGPALTSCQSTPAGRGGYIDAHVHVWTPDTARYPLAAGAKRSDMAPPSFTPEELFAHCRPEGVTRVVLIQMSFYRFDNRYMTGTIAAHPGVFSGVGIIDEHAADVRGRMRALARQGVRGFRIFAGQQPPDAWLGSRGMAEMWKVAGEEGLSICPLINPEALPAIDRMAVRYPQTRVVIDHFARIGMAGPVTRAQLDRLLHLSIHPQVHVKTSAFYALGRKQPPYDDLGPMIRELRDAFGADRLMWASDCPFQLTPPHSYRASIALIRDRLDFLTAGDKRAMLRTTAEKVFFT